MKVELRQTFEPGLPPDDTHPYRTGVWQPQYREYDAWDLDVVEGAIPDDIEGVYLRNTENPLFEPIKRYHPFDGDAMLHAISFGGGEARYANRFVRTDAFLAEQEAKMSLWAGITEHPSNAIAEQGWGARTMMKDNASTDVVVHGGVALASFYQCGELYRLDPVTLADLGKSDWSGRFPAEGVSAHPKVDEHTGEMLFFNYSADAPFMHYGVVSRDGELTTYIDVPLPGPRLPHDMAFTENWSILNDLPLYWDPKALAEGYYSNKFDRDGRSRFALIPRHGTTDDIRWFEAEPTFVLHWTNAYEDGDEVVLDGFFQHNPTARGVDRLPPQLKGFETLDMNTLQARAHRWRFNLVTGECHEESMSETCTEFPMINGRHAGRRHRYSYNAVCAPYLFAFNGLVKHDLDQGTEEVLMFDEGVFVSETVMAPKVGSIAEDDGYLVTFTSDLNTDSSECLILDAAHPLDSPVARIRLPERIASGTHSTWAPATNY
ncbi:MAG: carotenoid cleavage dioxygenase-like enzyme [Candidatus Poriferisodalaceae bacterium]|jgi:carotenoid cleavage dioxygenase-like enzyme